MTLDVSLIASIQKLWKGLTRRRNVAGRLCGLFFENCENRKQRMLTKPYECMTRISDRKSKGCWTLTKKILLVLYLGVPCSSSSSWAEVHIFVSVTYTYRCKHRWLMICNLYNSDRWVPYDNKGRLLQKLAMEFKIYMYPIVAIPALNLISRDPWLY